jgi:hypothetical protein
VLLLGIEIKSLNSYASAKNNEINERGTHPIRQDGWGFRCKFFSHSTKHEALTGNRIDYIQQI